LTTLVALVVVALTGLLAETALNKQALAEYRRQEIHSERVQAANERGWAIDDSAGAQSLVGRSGVHVLVAQREFRVSLAEGALRGGAVDSAEQQGFIEIVGNELSRYPAALLARAGLRYVLLCASLRRGGVRIGSLPNLESTLVLDVSASHDFLRRLVHHEVFHFIDFADDGQLEHDVEWAALNDHFFSYGNGGAHERQPDSARWGSGAPGFISGYGMAALEEDKAELFSFWMTAPAAVSRAARGDDIVRAKVAALRAQLIAFDSAALWLPFE
jgi:hypothetical protein